MRFVLMLRVSADTPVVAVTAKPIDRRRSLCSSNRKRCSVENLEGRLRFDGSVGEFRCDLHEPDAGPVKGDLGAVDTDPAEGLMTRRSIHSQARLSAALREQTQTSVGIALLPSLVSRLPECRNVGS